MSGETRKWTFSSGAEVETNIDGFAPMGTEAMAAALVAAGMLTQDEADRAIERRRLRRAHQQETSDVG